MRYYLIVAALMCVIFYSCTAADTEKTRVSDITYEELKAKVNQNAGKLRSLDADGEISIDSPTLSNNGTITVSINKPDSVYTKIEGPFGLDIANVLITRSNFVYYNVMDNRVIRGPSSSKNLAIIMRIKVEFDDIVNAFSGNFMIGNDGYTQDEIRMTDNNYIITTRGEAGIKKYWINNENYYVVKYGEYDTQGNTNLEITYDSFYEKDDIHFPKKITLVRPKEKQNIWLTYSKEDFNNDKLTYRLRIPKSAKETEWK